MLSDSQRLSVALLFSLGLHLLLGSVEGFGGAEVGGHSTDSVTEAMLVGRVSAIEVAFRQSRAESEPEYPPPPPEPDVKAPNAMAESVKPARSSTATDPASGVAALPKPPKPDVSPVLKGKIELAFPENPLLAVLGGEAAFLISIDDIGRVVELAVEASNLPAPLQSAAERALLKARFTPAMRDGYYVPSQMRWQVTITPEVGMELQTLGKPVISTSRE